MSRTEIKKSMRVINFDAISKPAFLAEFFGFFEMSGTSDIVDQIFILSPFLLGHGASS